MTPTDNRGIAPLAISILLLSSSTAIAGDPTSGRVAALGPGSDSAVDEHRDARAAFDELITGPDLDGTNADARADAGLADTRDRDDPALLDGEFYFVGESAFERTEALARTGPGTAVSRPRVGGYRPRSAQVALEAFAPDVGIGWETAFGTTTAWSFGWAAGVRGPAVADGDANRYGLDRDDPLSATDDDDGFAPALSFGFVFRF